MTQKLLEKDPRKRLSAKEALNHPWFTLESIGSSPLSIAEKKMSKYCNKGYFDVESIKPEFSAVKFFPLNGTQDLYQNEELSKIIKRRHNPLANLRGKAGHLLEEGKWEVNLWL